MTADADLEGAARYREIAENLRRIARELRFDLRRGEQLRALADGFERFADRMESAADADRGT